MQSFQERLSQEAVREFSPFYVRCESSIVPPPLMPADTKVLG